MIKNYVLLAIRNLHKNKLHTLINMLGMIVAFTCSIIIVLLVYQQFSYDNFQLNKNTIYKVYHYAKGPQGEETGTAMAYPLTPALLNEHIGIEKATSILNAGKLVRYHDKLFDLNTTLVDTDFLKMFTFPVLQGNTSTPLANIGDVVLTQTTAEKIFGPENPIGKDIEVKLGKDWQAVTISAVVKDFPVNSTIKFSLLTRTEVSPIYKDIQHNWDNQNHDVYVQLAGNTTQQQVEDRLRSLLQKYNPVNPELAKANGYKPDNKGDYWSLRLLPFKEEHFNPQLGNGSTISKAFLYILLLISGVIILIASFNFVNINIGLSFTRTKEIAVRKCLGARRKEIWLQVWGESFMMVFISMLFAVGAVVVLLQYFNRSFDARLSTMYLFQPVILIVLIGLVLIVSFIASGYPSAVLAKLKTVEILKGKITIKRPGFLRNALIVAQFVIAIALICSTIILFQQFNYLRSAPLGYTTQSVISIPIRNNDKGNEIVTKLRTRLASQSAVLSVSGSDVNFGLGEDHSTTTSVICFTYGDKDICGQVLRCGADILKTLSIQPVSGRDFSTAYAADTSTRAIATQSFADQFGKNTEAGFSYYADSTEPKINIVGIIPDIQVKSLSDRQRPVIIFFNKQDLMNYALVKVNTRNPAATMDMIKKVYAGIEPGAEFKGSYVNENIDRLYKDEKMMADLFTIAAAIAILLSCMGLFGIASIIIRQRVKEIGVRKVLGASIASIFTLTSREFVKPVIIAFLIAVPLCWWVMNTWLQNYTVRITIHWWVFAIAGMASLVITICTVSFHAIKAALANPVHSLRTD